MPPKMFPQWTPIPPPTRRISQSLLKATKATLEPENESRGLSTQGKLVKVMLIERIMYELGVSSERAEQMKTKLNAVDLPGAKNDSLAEYLAYAGCSFPADIKPKKPDYIARIIGHWNDTEDWNGMRPFNVDSSSWKTEDPPVKAGSELGRINDDGKFPTAAHAPYGDENDGSMMDIDHVDDAGADAGADAHVGAGSRLSDQSMPGPSDLPLGRRLSTHVTNPSDLQQMRDWEKELREKRLSEHQPSQKQEPSKFPFFSNIAAQFTKSAPTSRVGRDEEEDVQLGGSQSRSDLGSKDTTRGKQKIASHRTLESSTGPGAGTKASASSMFSNTTPSSRGRPREGDAPSASTPSRGSSASASRPGTGTRASPLLGPPKTTPSWQGRHEGDDDTTSRRSSVSAPRSGAVARAATPTRLVTSTSSPQNHHVGNVAQSAKSSRRASGSATGAGSMTSTRATRPDSGSRSPKTARATQKAPSGVSEVATEEAAPLDLYGDVGAPDQYVRTVYKEAMPAGFHPGDVVRGFRQLARLSDYIDQLEEARDLMAAGYTAMAARLSSRGRRLAVAISKDDRKEAADIRAELEPVAEACAEYLRARVWMEHRVMKIASNFAVSVMKTRAEQEG